MYELYLFFIHLALTHNEVNMAIAKVMACTFRQNIWNRRDDPGVQIGLCNWCLVVTKDGNDWYFVVALLLKALMTDTCLGCLYIY